MPTESGGNPGINYRGTQVRFTGDVSPEDIGAVFDQMDETPSPNPIGELAGSVYHGLNKGLDSLPYYGDWRIKRRKEEEERLMRQPKVGGIRG